MIETLWVYAHLGFEHITDLGGYDHIAFIVALCAPWPPREWRRIALLATAFTVGHSISLALAILDVVTVNAYWVELLIPITILITCITNLLQHRYKESLASTWVHYPIVMGFGLVHGLGFSNFLGTLLSASVSLWQPLLFFNLGLEVGQLIVVAIFLGVGWLAIDKFKMNSRLWNAVLSISVGVVSLALIAQRI